MAFRVPVFNLNATIWTGNPAPPYPPIGLPRLTTLAQLANSREPVLAGGITVSVPSLIRVAARTDIRGRLDPGGRDIIECPVGSGNWFSVNDVNDIARGFSNEYRVAVCVGVQVNSPMT